MLRLQNDQASLTESLSYTIKLWFYNKNFLHFYIFYKSCKPPPSLCSSSLCPSSSFSLPPLSSSSDTNCLLSPVYLAGHVISHLYYHQHLIKSDYIIIGVSFYSFQKSLPPLYSFVALGSLFHAPPYSYVAYPLVSLYRLSSLLSSTPKVKLYYHHDCVRRPASYCRHTSRALLILYPLGHPPVVLLFATWAAHTPVASVGLIYEKFF